MAANKVIDLQEWIQTLIEAQSDKTKKVDWARL